MEHRKTAGLLNPLPIPEWKWESISMDFVDGLPTTPRKHNVIWVVVDRLTKSAHFVPVRKDNSVEELSRIYVDQIVRYHGTPSSIVSDRGAQFTSHFWSSL